MTENVSGIWMHYTFSNDGPVLNVRAHELGGELLDVLKYYERIYGQPIIHGGRHESYNPNSG